MLIISGSWKVNRKHLTYMYIDEETTEEWFYVLHVVCMCLGSHTCTYTVQVLIRPLFTSQVHPKAIYWCTTIRHQGNLIFP